MAYEERAKGKDLSAQPQYPDDEVNGYLASTGDLITIPHDPPSTPLARSRDNWVSSETQMGGNRDKFYIGLAGAGIGSAVLFVAARLGVPVIEHPLSGVVVGLSTAAALKAAQGMDNLLRFFDEVEEQFSAW